MKRTTSIVVGAPVLVAVLGLAVFLAIRPELPDPVATHWGRSGPDGFTSLRWVTLPLLVGAVIGLLLGVAIGLAPAYLLLLMLLVAVVVGGSLYARVWVDVRGLTVRGPLGLPAYTVPLAEIAAVDVVEVSALGEYGGWGWRLGRRQRFGAVFRSGEALQVTRGDGRRFVVTVDGAAEAAALLTALTDRVYG